MKVSRGEIKKFILDSIARHPSDIGRLISERFDITRQSANYHLKRLEREGLIVSTGSTRSKKYSLRPIVQKEFSIELTSDLWEDKVWRDLIEPLTRNIRKNIVNICHYGFTEMFNNVIDHSGARKVNFSFTVFPNEINMIISDNGIGIFNKIVRVLGLEDHRHAILELAKGKLTTDPQRHSGEGIFFSSRMFDSFLIFSGKLVFHRFQGNDWLIEDKDQETKGTTIIMNISMDSERTTKEVFDRFSNEEDFGFIKTIIPIGLLKYGEENLISRSQAKRLIAGLNRFKEVMLDFKGINFIGQAFADEIFRVFQNEHPNIHLIPINMTEDVEKMIKRVSHQSSPN